MKKTNYKANDVALDDGFFNNKLVDANFNEFLVPTRLKLGKVKEGSIIGAQKDIAVYKTKNHRFESAGDCFVSIGDIKDSDPCDFPEYPASYQARVMVHHTLIKAGFAGKPVRLCTGLPINKYFIGADSDVNHQLIKRKQLNISGYEVTSESGVQMPRIISQETMPEGISSYYDYVCRKIDGVYTLDEELLSQDVAIVDIGGRTTDIGVISQGQLDFSKSDSISQGMIDIRMAVSKALTGAFDLESGDLSAAVVENAIHTGKITLGRETHLIESYIDKPKKHLMEQITNFIDNSVGGAKMLHGIIFVGGGSMVFEDSLKAFSDKAIFPVNPIFANARGLQKYIQFIDPQEPEEEMEEGII